MTDPATKQVVILTDNAQVKARKFLAEAGPDKVLRVGVESGGCSGFSYVVTTGERKSDDIIQSYDGFDVAVDPISVQFIQNATLDYVDDIGHAGFRFDNPQASSNCGCGTSFDVD